MISENARIVLERRYLKRREDGTLIEDPEGLFRRVANNVASAELQFDGLPSGVIHWSDQFYRIMSSLRFLPNSPTLMNAGNELQQLSACFVLPVGDSLEEIFETIKQTALIHQSGGGTGFSFSQLRPLGDFVKSTAGAASGPVSFMGVFDKATDTIKQGGKRRGANMGILRVDHPDIMQFIHCKNSGKNLTNFNISVGITDKFMSAVREGTTFELINPRTDQVVGVLDARVLFKEIAEAAWRTGDPGCIFLDTINSSSSNPVPSLGPIEATNPCGEEPLYPYESCNLGSINLAQFVGTEGTLVRSGDRQPPDRPFFDWASLKGTVQIAVRFLDNVIEVNHYPNEKVEIMSRDLRRIGLGVMGFADLLFRLRIPYDSEKAVNLAEEIMSFISVTANDYSQILAGQRGSFPLHPISIYLKNIGLRNANRTVIAPTGTISIIANCSSGIEPLFALAFTRQHYLDDDPNILTQLQDVNQELAMVLKRDFTAEEIMAITKRLHIGESLQTMPGISENIRRVFVTAMDIAPAWHLKMQTAFQKYTDNAVSKTINLEESATSEDIEEIYWKAWEWGCKGITVYRDRSRDKQVLFTPEPESSAVMFGSKTPVIDTQEQKETVKIRSETVPGVTTQIVAPEGKLNVTINNDEEGPLEVFINVSKAGSDVAALAEAIGRLISLSLRIPSSMTQSERLTEVVDQLKDIGGSRAIGFGENRVLSMPDAIAKVLSQGTVNHAMRPHKMPENKHNGNICPECGQATLVHQEGCQKCLECGYSEC